MKRRSALVQLVALYAEKGITSTKQLVELTGYTDRAIRAAKEEAGCRKPASAGSPLPSEPEAGCRLPGSPLPPDDASSRARIESTLRVDISSQEVVETANAATTPPAASPQEARQGKSYAFEGRVIRLLQADFDRWRKAYPALVDLSAALQAADDYYSERPPPDGKWFHRVSRWLQNENIKAAKDKTKLDHQSDKRARERQLLAMLRGEAVQ